MKIRHRLRYYAVLGAVSVAVGMVGAVGLRIAEDTKSVNAQESEDSQADYLLDHEEAESRSLILGEIEEENNYQYSDIEVPVLEAAGSLPAKYDLRDEYAVRQKDQHTEGMCWLYSSVTALEYSLAKKYENYEVSVKHLDYMTIDAGDVYKQAGKTNVYFDRYMNAGGYHRWSLGTSGAASELIYSVLNPLAIVSESDFTNVLKNNDSRLATIGRYEDIWSLDNKDDILQKNGEGYPSYIEKQDFDKVNDPSKVKYIVTGARLGGYSFDESRTAEDSVVKAVKGIIDDYGAVKISTFGTSDRFDNCSDKKTVDGRSVYTFIVDNRVVREDPNDPESEILYECKANHGMTIVGWDDDWEYEYNGETKRGAFILQNSWGEKEYDKSKWHLSYTSDLPSLLYFDSVEKYNDYDRYYGVEDYREQTIEPASDEYVFEFSLDGSEEIEAFVFSELYGAYEYDVYVSDTGKAGDFKKDGKFNSVAGIAKYEFNNEYEITSDYAIKMKRVNGKTISDADRTRGTMNVMSDKIWALNIDNGGDKTRETCRLNGNSCSVKIPTGAPIRAGYYFLGYADTANATTAKYQSGDTVMLSASKTIYAVWAPIYTLSISMNDGTGATTTKNCNPAMVDGSCVIVAPDIASTHADYYFLGYSDTPNATIPTYHPGDSITLSSNRTIYALWADGSIERQDDGSESNEYVVGSGKDMIIRINYPLANFTRLMIDNEEIDNINNDKYKVEEGSTIITVYNTHLDTIEPGDHILQAVYDNNTTKELSFTVTVAEDDNNDNNNTDGNEDEEDLPVPNTSSTTPDTGINTKQDENSINIILYILPITITILTTTLYTKHRNKAHRRFEW